MRPSVVAGILLISGFLALMLFVSKDFFSQHPPAMVSEAVAAPGSKDLGLPGGQSPEEVPVPNDPRQALVAQAAGVSAGNAASNATDAAAIAEHRQIHKRVLELYSLAMNDDNASRDAILSELENPQKKIREAALEAAIQFNDRSVVPFLREVASRTDDPREKTAILDAIEYINLPSLSEYVAERKRLGLPDAVRPANGKESHRPRPDGGAELPQSSPGN